MAESRTIFQIRPPSDSDEKEDQNGVQESSASYYTTMGTTCSPSSFATLPDTVFFRPAQQEDLDQISVLETAGFPEDEAESKEKIAHRMLIAGEFFMVAVRQEVTLPAAEDTSKSTADLTYTDAVVGFICGSCMTTERYSSACFNSHEPGGPRLCVHSVVIRKDLQRKGLAQRMLKAYLMFMQGTVEHLTHVHLCSKALLVPLYEKCGLTVIGPAQFTHGKDSWVELSREL